MFNLVKVIYYVVGTVAIMVVLIMFIRDRIHKLSICDSCEYLIRKPAGLFKYECRPPGCSFSTNSFDKPPEFCRDYKPRFVKKANEECGERKVEGVQSRVSGSICDDDGILLIESIDYYKPRRQKKS